MKPFKIENIAESASLLALVVILFVHLQPLAKIVLFACCGYWIVRYMLNILWAFSLIFIMLIKACYRILEYNVEWVLQLDE